MTIFDDYGWINELNKEFAGQSDRSAAIVGASVLDELLKVVLSSFLIDDKKKVKALFRFMPLRTFNSRIEMAYCIGIIGQQEYDLLNIINSVRNDFAHKIDGTSFTKESIQNKCREIKLPEEVIAKDSLPRLMFQEAVKYVGILLIIRSFQAYNRRCVKLEDLPPVIDFTATLMEVTRGEIIEIPPLSELFEDEEENG